MEIVSLRQQDIAERVALTSGRWISDLPVGLLDARMAR